MQPFRNHPNIIVFKMHVKRERPERGLIEGSVSESVFHLRACYGERIQMMLNTVGGGIYYPLRRTVYQAAPRGPENEAQRRFGRQGEVEDRIVHQIMFLVWECKDTFRILAGQTNAKNQNRVDGTDQG